MSSETKTHSLRKGDYVKEKNDPGLKILTKKLNLSEKQQEIFKALRKIHFERMDSIYLDVKIKKNNFFESMTAESIQDSVVLSNIEQAGIANSHIDKALFKHYKELMENTNDEQKVELRNIFSEMIMQ